MNITKNNTKIKLHNLWTLKMSTFFTISPPVLIYYALFLTKRNPGQYFNYKLFIT